MWASGATMQPPADAVASAGAGEPLQWRALGALFVAGGGATLLTLVAGVDPSVDRLAVACLGAAGVVAGLAFVLLAALLPEAGVAAGLLLALGLISGAVLASGEADTPYIFLYVWVAADAWFFLRPRPALAMTVVAVATSAAAMGAAANAADHAFVWWLMLNATLAAVSALTAVLRLRIDALMARLQADASHDALTDVLNRRGFDDRLGTEVERAARSGAPVSVVLADLDGFKALNDRFGHLYGDEVLRRFAAICVAELRGVDAVCRIGGDEFALVLPETDGDGAARVAHRIRRAFADSVRERDGVEVGASFGVACLPEDGTDVRILLANADEALYADKPRT